MCIWSLQNLEPSKSGAVGIHGVEELTSGAEPPVDVVVIEEDWFAGDKYKKWHLVPFGTKPEQLPNRPGKNRCDINEEEITRALHAFYQILLPDNLISLQNHASRSAAGVISGDMFYQYAVGNYGVQLTI